MEKGSNDWLSKFQRFSKHGPGLTIKRWLLSLLTASLQSSMEEPSVRNGCNSFPVWKNAEEHFSLNIIEWLKTLATNTYRASHMFSRHMFLKESRCYLEAMRASSLGGLETRSGSKRTKPSNSDEGEIVWRMWSELESVDVQKARIDTRSMDAKRTSNDFKLARILSSLVSCVGWNIGARAILQMLRRHSRHH